jgi:hypothetical protein
MDKRKHNGGKRKGSGRKAASDPKVQLCIYVEKSKVDKAGGVEDAKKKCYDYLTISAST